MDWLINKAIAHRGLHDNKVTAENSLEAFAAAMSRNYPIELDVHITTDGQIAVFHDDNLSRMTGVNKFIKDCNMKELKSLYLAKTECKIPTMKETLNFIQDHVPILIELKYDVPVGILESALLKLLNHYKGRFAIQSFDPFRVRWFQKHAPSIYRGQLMTDFTKQNDLSFHKRFFLKSMQIVKLSNPHFLSVSKTNHPNAAINKQRKKGRYIFTWTIKNEEQYSEVKKYSDSIIFEKFTPPNIICR